MTPEEIFSRFASRVVFLACDLSADDLAQASGVLVSADGFVVTNAHVVEGCRNMTATQISDTSRRSYKPVLKYYDKKSDTAVLKIAGDGFDSFGMLTRAVRVGERVYAIGNPRGLEQSISEGIVSGLREEDGTLWIQHSAPISPGSSGGALISSRGELLGINSWSAKESQGLNFAVPASTLARAYSGALALQGFLKFPGSPPVNQTQAPPSASPDHVPYSPARPWKPSPPAPPSLHQDPTVTGDEFIQKAREADLDQELPNFWCQEVVTRSGSETQKADWRTQDVLTFDLVYKDGQEEYLNPKSNGKEVNSGPGRDSGSWSSWEFRTLANDLFRVTAADFRSKGQETINYRAAKVYTFAVDRITRGGEFKLGSNGSFRPTKEPSGLTKRRIVRCGSRWRPSISPGRSPWITPNARPITTL